MVRGTIEAVVGDTGLRYSFVSVLTVNDPMPAVSNASKE
jgi:hypothetical protein